ncbi:ATP-binding protein [Stenotrophomonas pictorum JCM 9942]|uniref:ATP-binding protein n=1 Tax=Stenotrophomonas pictorum JCM 9942 TaxID=1236960 RepID=A0A0R0AWV6_9GAMM|nr:ATP-binding protein [Stenotrophomonas pictorum]KRG44883.1 ATP-binding protein [Stenotrophomonas pictorum JCM 9942]
MATPILLSWSGGKDAAWALHELRQREDFTVVALLTTLTESYNRSSMQGVRADVLQAQADAAGLPLVQAWIPPVCDNTVYLARMSEALTGARQRWPALETIAFGDLLLADIRDWRVQQYAELGWRTLFPLFGRDTAALARQMVQEGLRAQLCCVDSQVLDATFAGHAFDMAFLDALPAGVDACGENGEFHTCVSAGPMFRAPLRLRQGDTVLRDARYAYTDFLTA